MKALIIGFGSIGKKHFLALKGLGVTADVISSSYDKTNYEHFNFTLYKNLKQAPLNEYELFIIANITTLHFVTLKAIDKAVKDKIILVEKPLFECYKNYKSKKNAIYVAYLLRFHPVIMALKEFLYKDKKPYFASLECDSYLPNWRSGDYTKHYSAKKALGGGVSLDLSHELDLALWFFDKAKLEFSKLATISELQINSDDLALFVLKSKNTLIHICLNYFSKLNQRNFIIHTANKTYKADLVKNQISIYEKDGSSVKHTYETNTIATLQNLHKAIMQKDGTLCTLKEGLKVVKLITRAKNEHFM